MDNANIIASIAACLSAISYLPQAIKTIKTKDTGAISFWMYLLSFIGVGFWIVFGFMIGNYPVIIKNIVVMILSALILCIKTKHIISGKEDMKNSKFLQRFFKKNKAHR